MKATTIGIDLAKHLFQLHGVDQHGKTGFKRQLKRAPMLSFFSNSPPSLIGMEACGSAHYWVNKLQGLGDTIKLMAPLNHDHHRRQTVARFTLAKPSQPS